MPSLWGIETLHHAAPESPFRVYRRAGLWSKKTKQSSDQTRPDQRWRRRPAACPHFSTRFRGGSVIVVYRGPPAIISFLFGVCLVCDRQSDPIRRIFFSSFLFFFLFPLLFSLSPSFSPETCRRSAYVMHTLCIIDMLHWPSRRR